MSYNLRTLLNLIGVFSILLCLLTAAPDTIAVVGLCIFNFAIPAFLFAGAIYAGENLKAFCRGGLLPALAIYYGFLWYFSQVALQGNFVSGSQFVQAASELSAPMRRWTIFNIVMSGLMGLATLGFKDLLAPKPPSTPPTEA